LSRLVALVALSLVGIFGDAPLPPVTIANHEGNCYKVIRHVPNPDTGFAECSNVYGPDEVVRGWFRLRYWQYRWEPWGKEYMACASGWVYKSLSEAWETVYVKAWSSYPHIETGRAGFNPYIVYHHGSTPTGSVRCWYL
jgi:hypothetical protein